MSKMEPDEYINDRYKAIEERLAVGAAAGAKNTCIRGSALLTACMPRSQVVRKRLNTPLTLAEKVGKAACPRPSCMH